VTATTAGRILIGVGITGVLLSVLAAVAGLRLVEQVGSTLEAGADVAVDTVALAKQSLADVEATTRELEGVLADAEVVLAATADLSEDEVAGSVAAVDEALPALIDAAAVIDRTLSTLATLPFGPDYDPEEPFDVSLRRVQDELSGLPADLRAQAQLIRAAGTNLGAVRDGIAAVADDLSAMGGALESAEELLGGFATTDGRPQDPDDLAGRLRLPRLLIVALAATAAAAHVVPLLIGWLLLRPGAAPWADPGFSPRFSPGFSPEEPPPSA